MISGTWSVPCGPTLNLRGIGRSNGQCSTLTTTWTKSRFPGYGGGSGRRSGAMQYGIRVFDMPFSIKKFAIPDNNRIQAQVDRKFKANESDQDNRR